VSFINKALEKAKSLHHQRAKPDPAPSQASPPPWPHGDEGTGFAETAGEIHYTYTRTVTVDMDRLRRNRLMVAGSDEILGEAYRLLRTHILHGTERASRNTLMLTGPRPNEGKTLTTINLAIAIARKVGRTVLLVDADLRNPSVHRYLDLPAGPGLVDYLTSWYPIAESLVHPQGLANLVVLPAGRSTTHSVELLGSPRMVDLVRELKHFYPDRYVLFDLPPLLYADPLAFAPLVDGILLIVEAGSTPREEITRALKTLQEFPVLGCVLNKIDPRGLSYNYLQYYPDRDPQKKFTLPWRK
jgi:capsular exopolysaccharide synthesis family protein